MLILNAEEAPNTHTSFHSFVDVLMSLNLATYGRLTMSTIEESFSCPVTLEKCPYVEFFYLLTRPWGLAQKGET